MLVLKSEKLARACVDPPDPHKLGYSVTYVGNLVQFGAKARENMNNEWLELYLKKCEEMGIRVHNEGESEEWKKKRAIYEVTASVVADLWNAGHKGKKTLLLRILLSQEKPVNSFQERNLDFGKRNEEQIFQMFVWKFIGVANWVRSPGIWQIRIAGHLVGASPDGFLFLNNHAVLIEVKCYTYKRHHNEGKYWAQLYLQMMACKCEFGVLVAGCRKETPEGVEFDGPDSMEICFVGIYRRLAAIDFRMKERITQFFDEVSKFRAMSQPHMTRILNKCRFTRENMELEGWMVHSALFQSVEYCDIIKKLLLEQTAQGTNFDYDDKELPTSDGESSDSDLGGSGQAE